MVSSSENRLGFFFIRNIPCYLYLMFFRRLVAFCILVFLLPVCGFSQAGENLLPDSSLTDSMVCIVRNITITGNKITKSYIIERELSFHPGDTISGSELLKKIDRSRDNLLNTSLFNFVTILPSCPYDTSLPACRQIDIAVNVKERWYTWPAPIFEVYEPNFNTWWRNGHNLNRASYGFSLTRYNFRGRKETVALICRFGYSQQFGGQYSIPYLNIKRTIGITFTGTYTRNHEIAYATRFNKLVFYKDSETFMRGETSGSIMLSYRQGFYNRHTFDMRFTSLIIGDTIPELSADYFAAGKKRMDYFSVSYRFIRDRRDIRAYPLKGYYEEIEITKHGLGILKEENLNLFYLAANARIYVKLFPRIYGAAMLRGRLLPGEIPPYYHQRALGFSNYIRGYEYYVIDGQSYALAKVNFRYQLLKPHVFKFSFFPIEKFNTFHLAIYTGVFADAAYVDDRASVVSDQNRLGNTLLFGYGAGIDFVTYYDLSCRVEYAFNRMGENGFFLHFGAPF